MISTSILERGKDHGHVRRVNTERSEVFNIGFIVI